MLRSSLFFFRVSFRPFRTTLSLFALLAIISAVAPAYAQTAARTVDAPTIRALLDQNTRITSAVRSGVVSGPQLSSALTVRRDYLKNVMRNDPASTRSYALDDSIRSAILDADASAAALVEQNETITGELVGSVADDFKHGTSITLYTLHTFDRDLDLSFAAAIPGIEGMLHRQVTVRGISLADIMAVDSLGRATPDEVQQCASARSTTTRAFASQPDAAPATCSTTGTQRIAVLIVNFPNNTPSLPTGLDQAAYWNKVLFGANPSVNGFWNEVSYGQTSATGDVFGPFALSQSYDCTTTGAMENAAIAAAAGTVDFTQYNRIVIVFPAASCTFGGLANVGCQSASTVINHQYSIVWLPISSWYEPDDINPQMWGGAAHELGHNLGLGHANTLDFGSLSLGPLDFVASNPGTVASSLPPSGDSGAGSPSPITAVNTEYGDSFSVMGYPWNGGGPYSSEHRVNLLGWIPQTDEAEITTSGTYTLVPAESSSGLRALRVLRNPTTSSWLWLEFHQPTGFYTPNNMAGSPGSTLTDGALIHYEDGSLSSLYTYLLDMTPVAVSNNFLNGTLAPGESWSDPYSLLTLTVGSQTSSSLGITANYDTPCATLSLSASELSFAGGTANLAISAPSTCSWTVSSNASWISFPGTISGSGNATIPFAYAANTTTTQRNSYITAQRQSLPVIQDGPDVTIVGVSPNMGSGSSQSFVINVVDTLGASDLKAEYFMVGSCEVYASLGGPGSSSYLYLINSTSSSWITPGSTASASTGNCTLWGQGSSVVYNGNQVLLTVNLSFSSSFTGTHSLFVTADTASKTVGQIPVGIYTINGFQAATTPIISPAGGTFTSLQTATITDATPSSTIYYTIDGSGPTTNSPQYTGPITISQTETVQAIAIAPGYSQSPVAAATFTMNLPAAATPVISPNGGTFASSQTVTITDTTAGALIYYTTDNSTPTISSSKYSAPITVTANETIKAIAVANGYTTSSVAIAQYTILLGSATTLQSSVASVAYGGTVTLTTSVTAASGSGSPTGSASFYDSTSLLATVSLTNGSAPYTTSSLAVGSHTLTAVYSGDATFATSTSSPVTVVVNPPPKTTPTVTTTLSSSNITTVQTLTATVTVNGGSGNPIPTGSVTLTGGGYTSAVTTLTSGSATINVPAGSLTAGADTLTASYTPDSASSSIYNSAIGTSPAVTVTQVATTTTLSVANSVTLGNSITLTATVSPAQATGSVTFKNGSTAIGSGTLSNGTATLTLAAATTNGFTVGSDSITAIYSGNASYAGSTSSAATLTVTENTSIALTISPSSIALGSASATQSFSATVTTASGTPTGTLVFKVGTVTVGSAALISGNATLSGVSPTTANGFTVGSNTVTASYTPGAGSGFLASSGTQTLTVTAPAYTITPSAASISLSRGGAQGDAVTLASTTFADTTTWTATTSSPLITVSPSSGTATLSANGSSTATLTITAANSAANHAPKLPWTGGLIVFSAVLAGIPIATRRKRTAAILLTSLAISALAFMMSCGGGGGSSAPPVSPRQYTVTISGTGGISSTIAVTVQ